MNHSGQLPDNVSEAAELEQIANGLLSKVGVNKQALSAVPRELAEYDVSLEPVCGTAEESHTRTIATTAAHELSPVCAVVGGMLAQDILKALAARESPIANFFTFDGSSGGATVCRLGM